MLREKRFKNLVLSKNNERGNALVFFVLFIIPLLSFLLMVSFEVTAIYTQKRKIQDVLDDAALLAVRSFPYSNHVEQVAREYLSHNNIDEDTNVSINIAVGQDGISIYYEKPYQLIFSRIASVFMRDRADENFLTWRVKVFTFASPQIGDYMILLDRSENVAPQDETKLWGEVGLWPASPILDGLGLDVDKRFYTQQCFNPVFTPLKEASVSLYNYLGNFALNQVGFLVTPGGSAGRQVDYLLPIGVVNFNNKNRNYYLLDYASLNSPTQEDCYNIANNGGTYKFIDDGDDTSLYVKKVSDKVSDFSNNVSFQKDIWSIPSHHGFKIKFDEVLEQSLNHLISSPSLQTRQQASKEITKNLIFLTSKLPNSLSSNSDIEDAVNNVCRTLGAVNFDTNINVLYAIYNYNNLISDSDISRFRAFLNGLSQRTCMNFSLIDAKSSDNIGDEIFQYMQINQKRGHLWR